MTEFNKEYFKNILPKRPENSHKGTFGHVLNIAGSEFYTGAAYFSCVSPLKVGCGKVSLLAEKSVLQTISVLSPDVILLPLKYFKKEMINQYQVVSIGCGLSQSKNASKLFKKVIGIINKAQTSLIIDADGLNILGKIEKIELPSNTILTPHPTELSRLMGVSTQEILSQPEEWAKKCCEKYKCITVLKLHKTIVADNKDGFYVNDTGNSALSHGGSGDVLCGMIAGFVAQGVNIFEASVLGVYLHGVSAEISSRELSEYSVLASDLLKYIPDAIKTLL